MKIKFASDIVKEIENRGSITVPEGYVTGEAFENWLYEKPLKSGKTSMQTTVISYNSSYWNIFSEDLGEAA